MAISSILASRSIIPDELTESSETRPTEDVEKKSPLLSGSESLLKFLQIISSSCVGVTTDLEPVQHLETLGEGLSFSVKVHYRKRSGNYVIKVFKHSLAVGPDAGFDRDGFKALTTEAYVLGHRPLHDHENIVTMAEVSLAVWSNNPLQIAPGLVLERASHGTLAAFQQSHSKARVSWSIRKSLAYDVAAGLDALHRCGVVHGDLKAENVLIFDHPARGYIAKISDLGSAVIVPEQEAPDQRMRLTAYTPPWHAPEATGYVSSDDLCQTDVYSLGLLIWRILVHSNPFESFDLPLEPGTRLEHEAQMLSSPDFVSLIPIFVEEEVGYLHASDILLLTGLFANTVNHDPGLRSLSRVLNLLHPESGRQFSSDPGFERLRPLQDGLDSRPIRLDWIQMFHHLVQVEIFSALEDLGGYEPLQHGRAPHQRLQDRPALQQVIVWAVFQCHLLGIGTVPNASIALDVLFYAGFEDYGALWECSILIKRLYNALEVQIPPGRELFIEALTARAQSLSILYLNMFCEPVLDQRQVAKAYNIDIAPEEYGKIARSIIENDLADSAKVSIDGIRGGNTLLHAAALFDDAELATSLVEGHFVNINAVNESGETALLLATKHGACSVVDTLLKVSADASIGDERGWNPLFWLSSLPEQSKEEMAERLFANGARLFWAFPNTRQTENAQLLSDAFFLTGSVGGGSLMQAIVRRDLSSVKILLQLSMESGEQPLVLLGHLFPVPLRLASELNLYEILDHLCQKAFEVIKAFRKGESHNPPSLVGAYNILLTMSSAILRGAVSMSHHIHRLCYHGKHWKSAARKTLRVLLHYGFQLTHLMAFGSQQRLINYTIACGNCAVLEELLSQSHIVKAVDEIDEQYLVPPVHAALNSRRLEMLKLLISVGATVDLRTKCEAQHSLTEVGASYLHVIASLRIEDNAFASLILDQGVPPDIKDNRGLDAFGLALTRCNFSFAMFLLERGYDLRSRGIFGVTQLGDRFMPNNAFQHDDIYEAVRFLLSLDKEHSLFIVEPIHQQSILHIAAAFPLANENRYKDVLRLLLSKYHTPEQLNFKTSTSSQSTPLQVAVASHNPLAAAALIDAGADFYVDDLDSTTIMGIARSSITKILASEASVSPKDAVTQLNNAFSTLAVLTGKGASLEAVQRQKQLKEAQSRLGPLLDRMGRQSHRDSYILGLETEAFGQINQLFCVQPGPQSLDLVEDYRREINHIIEPCLYAELAGHISPSIYWSLNQSKSYQMVWERIPWTKSFDNSRLAMFQQAAAFEWLLDKVRQQMESASAGEDGLNPYGLAEYAKSGDPATLPLDYRFVRWPPSLLDWYIQVIQRDNIGAQLSTAEREEIFHSVQLLRARASVQARGHWDSMPPLTAQFRKLHFEDLQPAELDFDSTVVTATLMFNCRCFRRKISSWTLGSVEYYLDAVKMFRDAEHFGIGHELTTALNQLKDSEIERKRENVHWKASIGIIEGEGRLVRSGLRRAETDSNNIETTDLLLQRLSLPPPDAADGSIDPDDPRLTPPSTRCHDSANEPVPDHVAAALHGYLFYAYSQAISDVDRDEAFAIKHLRDVIQKKIKLKKPIHLPAGTIEASDAPDEELLEELPKVGDIRRRPTW